jgi:hypothetical protein
MKLNLRISKESIAKTDLVNIIKTETVLFPYLREVLIKNNLCLHLFQWESNTKEK